MAILRSIDGKFYNVPDEVIEDRLVPASEVKAKLQKESEGETPADEVNTHHHSPCRWRNCWRNCWRRNCY